ncbi:TPA: hypothetical protein N0F65_004763 [Lagenidium giganteum]|uniref:Voltage-gated hydrogen channel 1 n=1 Tax=Lagenidium giganteum TaxID=4803 RepID=A0AAV2YUV7_9STRA|nr:TPA: hypothetical protein N0F65_004763 [Lagenidium giganteum]
MAELLETIRVQLVIIMAIAMDVVFAAAELYLQNQLELARYQSVRVGEDSVPVQTMRMALRVINSCTGFTTMFFLLELIVLACAFRLQFIRHIGYVLDLILVSSSWIHELSTQSKLLRLLGLLRLWRVFRLVHSLVERERREHDVTRQLLENEKKVVMNLRVEKDAAQQTLGKEYESRAALEVLLQGYKDEIDTMKEALSIAAQAVAAAELRDGAFEDTSMGDYYAHDSEVTKAAAQNNDDAIVHGELDTPEQVSSIKQAPLKDATSTHKATEPSLANPEVDDEGFEDAMEA